MSLLRSGCQTILAMARPKMRMFRIQFVGLLIMFIGFRGRSHAAGKVEMNGGDDQRLDAIQRGSVPTRRVESQVARKLCIEMRGIEIVRKQVIVRGKR